ncbi:MAG TPA: alpha/beta hydrolase [Chitinophagaceae bacterium]|nr:alpha/beta hydrolase [Chitinophagaceae bacterium]
METETKRYHLTIPVNNFHLSYDDVGEGSIPIIFLHGYPFDKSMWQGQLDFLKSHYRLIACDIRGFGKSRDEESALSIDLFADDLIAFMDQLSIDKAIICGLSMGGYIALNAMKRFPDRFKALILCDTQCIADPAEVKEKRHKTIDEIAVNGAASFNEGFIKSVFQKDSITNKKELVEQLRSVVFSNSKHIIRQGLVALAKRSEICSALNQITIPTLIICGREDEVTPLAQSEMMNAAIKGSILRVIDHAGHVSNLEQPGEFNNHLFNFLSTLNDDYIGNYTENKKSIF